MLAEIEGVGEKSKKISRIYETLIKKAGSEFNLLHFLPLDDVAPIAGEVLTEGIRRMRSHEVSIKEGYDGEYGEVNVFQPDEVKYLSTQESLFEDTTRFKKNEKQKLINFDLSEYRKLEHLYSNKSIAAEEPANYEKPHSETLEGLNPQQMNATTHLEGTAAVMAGPGTGKTRVLTRRIAWLIKEQRILPDQILAITFTNKAAEEMQQRCNTLLKTGNTGKSPNISTFHAFGYQVIDQHRKLTGLREGFSIMDETNQVDFMANLFQISKKEAKRLGRKITTLKQEMTDLKDIQDDQLKEAFERYNEKLMQYNLVDLDDLICLPVKMLQEHQSLQKEMHQKHPWILVDEFQDINYMQYLLLQLLTNQSENPNLYVIGDPNQAIYGFRGSSTRFISRLISDYKETQVHKLHTSYRCSNQILKASGNILQQDALEGLNDGVKIKIAPQTTDKSEAEYIARTIEQLSGGLRFFSMDSNVTQGEGAEEIESLSDFAILCRTKAQMKIIEKALLDHTIPYQLIAEDTFFHHPTVQLIRDILELSVNPANQFLQLKLNELDLDFQSLIKNLQTIENVQDKTSHIVSHLNDDQLLDKELIPKINQLTRQYGNQTHEFLQYLTIGKGQDIYEKETEKVTVMTLHASKGLEFKCVFIAGCENGLIPYSFFPNQEIDKEEEERLLYVGMTRAQSYLYLTHAKKRFLMGKEQEMQRSPFLNRIEKSLMEIEKNACRKKQKDDKQLKLF
jgi:superfamily I DNA/RNA helicase